VPVTVSVKLPLPTDEATVTVRVEVPDGLLCVRLTGLGVNITWTPVGGVEVDSVTSPKPLRVIVDVPEDPAVIVRDVGLAVIVKSVTSTVTVVLWLGVPGSPLAVPVTTAL